MMIESYALTHEGNIRRNNEDNFFLCGKYKKLLRTKRKSVACQSKKKYQLFAVCDGMGGEEMGEWASRIAVQNLRTQRPFSEKADTYIQRTNGHICKKISAVGKRIGTTFAALSIECGIAHVFNLGDSRVYLHRDDALQQISTDDTAIQRLVDSGVLSPAQAAKHPDRHRLSQHLGIFSNELIIQLHKPTPFPVKHGDVFLLCSDGLTDMMSDEEISSILSQPKPIKELASALQSLALNRGGKDNLTVLIVRIRNASRKAHGGAHG